MKVKINGLILCLVGLALIFVYAPKLTNPSETFIEVWEPVSLLSHTSWDDATRILGGFFLFLGLGIFLISSLWELPHQRK